MGWYAEGTSGILGKHVHSGARALLSTRALQTPLLKGLVLRMILFEGGSGTIRGQGIAGGLP